MENNRKILYKLIPGLPKYSGAILPKMAEDNIEKMNSKTIPAAIMSNENRNANFMPLRSCLMFGIKRITLKLLNKRIDRKASTAFVAIECSINGLANEGKAIMTTIKSKRFQLLCQYFFHPSVEIFTTASIKKSKVKTESESSNHVESGQKPPRNMMMVFSTMATSIMCSLQKNRLKAFMLYVAYVNIISGVIIIKKGYFI